MKSIQSFGVKLLWVSRFIITVCFSSLVWLLGFYMYKTMCSRKHVHKLFVFVFEVLIQKQYTAFWKSFQAEQFKILKAIFFSQMKVKISDSWSLLESQSIFCRFCQKSWTNLVDSFMLEKDCFRNTENQWTLSNKNCVEKKESKKYKTSRKHKSSLFKNGLNRS